MGNYGNGSEQWWWLWEKTNLYFFHGRQWQWRRVPVSVLDGWSCHQHQWQPPTKWNLLNRRQSSFPGKGYKSFFFNRWYCATEICKWLLSLRSHYLADTKLFFIMVVFINILTLKKEWDANFYPKFKKSWGLLRLTSGVGPSKPALSSLKWACFEKTLLLVTSLTQWALTHPSDVLLC